jgi:hypothetical protein
MCAREKVGGAKGTRIFWMQRNGRESRLVVSDDGTVTYHVENFGWRLMRDGSRERSQIMSAGEAKLAWSSYAKAIDTAVAEIAGPRLTLTKGSSVASSPVVRQDRWSLARLSTWSFGHRRTARAT